VYLSRVFLNKNHKTANISLIQQDCKRFPQAESPALWDSADDQTLLSSESRKITGDYDGGQKQKFKKDPAGLNNKNK